MAWPDKQGDKNLSIVEPTEEFDHEFYEQRRKDQLVLLTAIRDFTLRGEVSQHDIFNAVSAILGVLIQDRTK